MKTLPDRLRPGLRAVSIGINPSIYSVERGFYFARPQNRFWKALAASRLGLGGLEPGMAAVETLFRERGIGFTDVVKRPTRSAAELSRSDWQRGALDLREKLLRYRPLVAWFHGRVAWENFQRYTAGTRSPFRWGRQPQRVGDSIVFVTPNPSGLNAAYTPADLARWYRRLAGLVDSAAAPTRRRLESARR